MNVFCKGQNSEYFVVSVSVTATGPVLMCKINCRQYINEVGWGQGSRVGLFTKTGSMS